MNMTIAGLIKRGIRERIVQLEMLNKDIHVAAHSDE